MQTAPKALRLHIGIFGRTNVGKSSVLNMLANQDVAITSSVPGTTTDVVEKSMELLPIGPVNLLDTAGIDDVSLLSEQRIERTKRALDRSDVVLIVIEPNNFTHFEDELIDFVCKRKLPYIVIINKTDKTPISDEVLEKLQNYKSTYVAVSSVDLANRDKYITDIKHAIVEKLPDDFISPPPLIGDLIPQQGLCVLIVPIDLQAPKGRLILPQVQAIRDILDASGICVVVKESEYPLSLATLKRDPDLVVCDSQVVHKMMADTPPHIKTTTFSILFSRYKGDLLEEVRGAASIKHIKPGDKILIAEACTHHPTIDDIGRIKIPRWLKNYLGFDPDITIVVGRDFPENIKEYKLIIHCGSCMLTRNEKIVRIMKAKEAGVPITNYGVAISMTQGVLERALSPFPEALKIYYQIVNNIS